jgi:CheY-like chemotaxis protein/HPt (histidine-containing phosphotransfer) domain-containing protein
MLSSAAFDEEAARALEQGIHRYLNKPVKQTALYDCLKAVMVDDESTVPDQGAAIESAVFEGHVLVAEDNRTNCEVIRNMLEMLGCEVEIVVNGREAVEAVSSENYDLVLMDFHMPELDGLAATSEIRRREQADGGKRGPVPIVALTADVQKGTQEKCMQHGMDAYLSKPFTQLELAQLLKRWLPHGERAADGVKDVFDAIAEDGERAVDPVLDRDVLDRLRALQRPGAPSVLAKLIDVYLADSLDMMAGLKQALNNGDVAALTDIAHSLKSSSANLGANRLSAVCKELEVKGKAGAIEGLDSLVARIDAEYDSAKSGLQTELEQAAVA